MLATHDTIAAIATPPGNAGIGIIRISGPETLAIARRLFVCRAFRDRAIISRHLYHGRIVDPRDSSNVDDVLLAYMPGPRSYTGEDTVEINCHGGLTVMRSILGLILSGGARTADPGEFTRRAFLNGRMDLAQAEAVIELIESRSETGLKIAARQLRGALSEPVAGIREKLIDLLAALEACIDFPEDDIEILSRRGGCEILQQQCGRIRSLLDSGAQGELYRNGVDAVIAGKPNVGKSSIMNVLLGDERSIVTAIPGTTRDIIREPICIAGVPVRLHDTAGIHGSTDAVETIGMDRALDHLDSADITLLVLDGSRSLDADDLLLLGKKQPHTSIAVINKGDLPRQLDADRIAPCFRSEEIVSVSALTHTGFDTLRDAIARLLLDGGIAAAGGDVLITTLRHRQALGAAMNALNRAMAALNADHPPELISIDVQDALHSLGEITGQTTSSDILDAIFARFCIGK